MDATTMQPVVDLIVDLDRAGVQELTAEGDTLGYRPKSAMTAGLLQRLVDLKPEVLAARGSPGPPGGAAGSGRPERDGAQPATAEIDWWSLIGDADRQYLTGPRNWPEPCAWCGGRTVHSELCKEPRASWKPRFTFGKYRGHKVSDVPVDYRRWLVRNGVRINDVELRSAVERRAGMSYPPGGNG